MSAFYRKSLVLFCVVLLYQIYSLTSNSKILQNVYKYCLIQILYSFSEIARRSIVTKLLSLPLLKEQSRIPRGFCYAITYRKRPLPWRRVSILSWVGLMKLLQKQLLLNNLDNRNLDFENSLCIIYYIHPCLHCCYGCAFFMNNPTSQHLIFHNIN